MKSHQIDYKIIVQKDGFLCAAMGTRLSIVFNKRLGSSLVGGMPAKRTNPCWAIFWRDNGL